jgi:hypothetical protein
MPKEGTRAQVMHGTAERTSGGLQKGDLKYNKQGRIVSRRRSQMAKRDDRLKKAGWTFKKGEFGAKKIGEGSPTRKSRSSRRGSKKRSAKKSPTRRSKSRPSRRSR